MDVEQIMDLILAKPNNLSILISLIITLLFAALLLLTYRLTYDNKEYNANFATTLAVLAIIATILMNLIQSNLALSLGMLGSLSIVRFRTTIKDPRDMGFIFWAMAIGIASATKAYGIGLIGSIILAVFMICSKAKQNNWHNMLLVIKGKSANMDTLDKIIASLSHSYNVKAKNIMNTSFEIVFEVELNEKNENQMITELFTVSGIDSVNLLAPVN